jgi:hypothetical protein
MIFKILKISLSTLIFDCEKSGGRTHTHEKFEVKMSFFGT